MKHSFIASLLALAFACTSPSADKGAEYAPFTSGKADGTLMPIDQGRLAFGDQVGVEVTSDALAFAWNVTLNDDAELEILTLSGYDDFDTVLYFFAVDAAGEATGMVYVNDDYEGSLNSGLQGTFPAGEYRIIAKAFERGARGIFELVASCSGDGCEGNSVGEPMCAALGRRPHGGSCGEIITGLFEAPGGEDSTQEVNLVLADGVAAVENECDVLDDIELSAAIAYIDEHQEALAGHIAAGDVALLLETRTYGMGSGVVSIWTQTDDGLGDGPTRFAYDEGLFVGSQTYGAAPRLGCEAPMEASACFGDAVRLITDSGSTYSTERHDYDGENIESVIASPGASQNILAWILAEDFGNAMVSVELTNIGLLFQQVIIEDDGERYGYILKPIDSMIVMTFDSLGESIITCQEI